MAGGDETYHHNGLPDDLLSSKVINERELKVALYDGAGNPLKSLKGALDIHDADVHNVIINKYAHAHAGTVTTLTADVIGDGSVYEISVADATGFSVGDYVHINTTSLETTHPVIKAISSPTGPSVFTLDRRLDNAHSIGDEVQQSIVDMSDAVGTLASPQEYWIQPPAGEIWHITRLLFSMILTTAGDLGLFGNLPALENGVVLRAKINNQYGTFTNWKTNADIKADMYDVDFDVRSSGQGNFGMSGRGTFKEAGAVIRLDGDTNDRIEIYIQDDISLLGSFTMKFQGHIEGL